MSPQNAVNERDVLRLQLRFHRALNAGLLLTLLVGTGLLAYATLRQPTVLIPIDGSRNYAVGAGFANRDYLQDMAGYVLGLVLTVTPDTADYNNRLILKMTDPDAFGALETFLSSAAQRLKKERVTTIWVPHKEEVSTNDKRVKVSGKLKTYIADKLTSEREKQFLVEFIVSASGRLYVSRIEELPPRNHAQPAGA